MSNTQYKAIARRFIEEIFNARKLEAAKNFVTSDIIYHGIAEDVRGLEDFKKWVDEDLSYRCFSEFWGLAELPLEIASVQHQSQSEYRHKYQYVTRVITRSQATT